MVDMDRSGPQPLLHSACVEGLTGHPFKVLRGPRRRRRRQTLLVQVGLFLNRHTTANFIVLSINAFKQKLDSKYPVIIHCHCHT